mgnify:FL=1|tara:strand:+ start:16793 stop:16984 length:192 start_codon:yes stop_codon:yes gene_type:complete
MTNETFTIWFQDGGGRETFTGRTKLRELAKRYDFDADEVIKIGETEMLDEDKDVIGGVFRENG